MTPQEFGRYQRDMVARSILLAPTAAERSEERRVARRPRPVTPDPALAPSPGAHVYRLPIVTERLL